MADGNLDEGEASVSSEITLDPTASYTLVGVQSNLCVGPVGGSAASGVRLEIETCTGTANQRFRPEAMGGGFFRLRNELNGLCMDVSGASIEEAVATLVESSKPKLSAEELDRIASLVAKAKKEGR